MQCSFQKLSYLCKQINRNLAKIKTMTKALFINGSPRKNGNTAQLMKRAIDGAREAGAEVRE